MPDPTGTKFDGAMSFGTQVVTIASVTYVAEDINVTRGSNSVVQKNQFGVPTRKVHVRDVAKGSVTLQYADNTTDPPALFAEVSLAPSGGGAAQTFIITEVGDEQKMGDECKCKISVEEKLAA